MALDAAFECLLRIRRRAQAARLYLSEALVDGKAAREPSVQAKVGTMLGQVEEWSGNTKRADDHFELAIGTLGELGKPEELRDAHMALRGPIRVLPIEN